jgi:hypothetical protein
MAASFCPFLPSPSTEGFASCDDVPAGVRGGECMAEVRDGDRGPSPAR